MEKKEAINTIWEFLEATPHWLKSIKDGQKTAYGDENFIDDCCMCEMKISSIEKLYNALKIVEIK